MARTMTTVAVTPGAGASVEAVMASPDTDLRQVIVVGDPDTAANLMAVDTLGRITITQNVAPQVTAAWVAATGLDATLSLTVTGLTTAVISFVKGGAITAGQVYFEGDDGSGIWWPMQAVRIGSTPVMDTSYVLTGTNQVWQVNVAGFTTLRARLNPQITGSSTPTANMRMQATEGQGFASPQYMVRQAMPTISTTIQNAGTISSTVDARGFSLLGLELPAGVATPVAPTVNTATSGGTILAGTYKVMVAYCNAAGGAMETLPSASVDRVTTGTTSTITVVSPGASTGATHWYAYVTQINGTAYTRQQAAGSPTILATNLVLTAPPTSSGLAPSIQNTTAMTGSSITFLVSPDGVLFQLLTDVTNQIVKLTIVPGQNYDLPGELGSWPFWQLVSASTEQALRTYRVVGKG